MSLPIKRKWHLAAEKEKKRVFSDKDLKFNKIRHKANQVEVCYVNLSTNRRHMTIISNVNEQVAIRGVIVNHKLVA